MRLASTFPLTEPSDLQILTAHNWWLAYETEDKKTDKHEVEMTTKFIMKSKDGELGNYYVACSDHNNRIPIASLMLSYEYNIVDDRHCHWFQSVYVRDQYRSKGVFSKMFKDVENLGLEAKHNKVKLYVETDNMDAIRTYEKKGMYKLDNHSVYEFDGVFAFGTKKANIASTKANVQTFLNNLNSKLSSENIDLETKLVIQLGNSRRMLQIGEQSVDLLEKYDWSNLRSILDIYDSEEDEKVSSDYLRRIKENLLNQKKWGSVWLIDRQLEDGSYEIVSVFTTFQEYSDWRSGNMHWLYDARVNKKYLENTELCNLLMLYFVKGFFSTIVDTNSDLKVLRV